MLRHSATLYFSAVFIWGSTFFAIKFQLGDIAPELSIAYRFGLAALILFGWCVLRDLPLRFSLQQHRWMALQGIFLFCLNYLLVYHATARLSSGLIAVIFSTIVLMNIINGAIFLRKPTSLLVLLGALCGLLGIALIFAPEISGFSLSDASVVGIILSLLGTYVASLGNIISARNQHRQVPVIQSNAYGMAYGAVALFLAALAQGKAVQFDFGAGYSLSLLYLALFGSVLAFGSYLTLLGRIGPEKAAYTMVLFPLVALGISTLFEGYQWSPSSIAGVALVLLGNVIIIMPKTLFRRAILGLSSGRQK
jgi:drug/metabolite transporter (DMT)-like permease